MRHRRRPSFHNRRSPLHMERLLQSLLALYQLLRAPRPIDDLLQTILDTAIACVPGAQRGSLMVREGDELRYRAAHGYDLSMLRQVRYPAQQVGDSFTTPSQRVTQVQGFQSWDSANLDAEMNHILMAYGHLDQIRRSIVASIVVAGRFYGTLVLDNLRSYAPFPPAAEPLAALLAEQSGALIEYALLIDQLRQTNQRLAEAEQLAALGRLVAGVAHEINNPLTAVLGHSELLALEDLSASARESVTQIEAGAERVQAIVRNLQIFARQQRAGESELDLAELIDRALALKRPELALDRIVVRKEISPGLPKTWGDAGQLSQVLLNLLANAQHALWERDEPRVLTIKVWAEHQAQAEGDSPAGPGATPRILAAVADNGPGIAPELLPHLFEPFFTTKPVGQGSGLGLSVCYGIIVNHGGRIWAESEPGQGATFVFELPVRAGQAAAAPARSQLDRPAPPRGYRLLLIDDDAAVVDLIRSALGSYNTIAVAHEGAHALELLRDEPFDVLLCDLKMPGMSGPQLYQQLQLVAPGLAQRVLFISGDTGSAATRDFLRQAGRPLLHKPFTLSELYRAIALL